MNDQQPKSASPPNPSLLTAKRRRSTKHPLSTRSFWTSPEFSPSAYPPWLCGQSLAIIFLPVPNNPRLDAAPHQTYSADPFHKVPVRLVLSLLGREGRKQKATLAPGGRCGTVALPMALTCDPSMLGSGGFTDTFFSAIISAQKGSPMSFSQDRESPGDRALEPHWSEKPAFHICFRTK